MYVRIYNKYMIVILCNVFVGNYGPRLIDDSSGRSVDLYISRDGGLRWDHVSCMCNKSGII